MAAGLQVIRAGVWRPLLSLPLARLALSSPIGFSKVINAILSERDAAGEGRGEWVRLKD